MLAAGNDRLCRYAAALDYIFYFFLYISRVTGAIGNAALVGKYNQFVVVSIQFLQLLWNFRVKELPIICIRNGYS